MNVFLRLYYIEDHEVETIVGTGLITIGPRKSQKKNQDLPMLTLKEFNTGPKKVRLIGYIVYQSFIAIKAVT